MMAFQSIPRRAPVLAPLALVAICACTPVAVGAADNRPSLGDLEREAGRETGELIREAEHDLTHRGEEPAGTKDHGEDAHAEKSTNPFDWQTDLALWTGVVFLVLLLVLWKFAWGPIASGLDRRESSIADQIAQAEQANNEARELLAQYERQLTQAGDEVRGIIDTGRREAEKQGRELIERAHQEATQERDRALREIESASAGAMKELAERSATMAVRLAGRIVAGELKPADHERLIRQAINDFSKQN